MLYYYGLKPVQAALKFQHIQRTTPNEEKTTKSAEPRARLRQHGSPLSSGTVTNDLVRLSERLQLSKLM